tara:strand:+ start:7964 stop:8170 length:207 start_codon:yes stop_codon:yes gene_type:complete
MKYVDDKGKVYEISYSQRLQAQQNKLLKQKNYLIAIMIGLVGVFFIALFYLYVRLDAIDILTKIANVL